MNEKQKPSSLLSVFLLSNCVIISGSQFAIQLIVYVFALLHLNKITYPNSFTYGQSELFTQLFTQQSTPIC